MQMINENKKILNIYIFRASLKYLQADAAILPSVFRLFGHRGYLIFLSCIDSSCNLPVPLIAYCYST